MIGMGTCGRGYLGLGLNHDRLGFIVQRCFATATEMVVRPELDEVTMVTSNYFPGINWS
jgi:hypothetical protein